MAKEFYDEMTYKQTRNLRMEVNSVELKLKDDDRLIALFKEDKK